VLITGASRGIGESLTHAFRSVGAVVALVARSENAIQTLAAELEAQPTLLTSRTRRRSPPSFSGSKTKAGPVDVLVNNAGLDAAGGFADAPGDELRQVAEVNYLTPAETMPASHPPYARAAAAVT